MEQERVVARSLARQLQDRCDEMLQELAELSDFLKRQKREHGVEVRTFRSSVQGERKAIDRLSQQDPDNPKTSLGLDSSNLIFYSAVWSMAKSCTSVTALSRTIYRQPMRTGRGGGANRRHTGVDIVANGGLEWIKISLKSEKRVIWDLAKAGWVGSSSDEDEDVHASPQDDDPEGLVKLAETLMAASRANRVRHQCPKVRLVLPRIKSQPAAREVADVLRQIRELGVTVQTSEDMQEERPLSEVLERMTSEQHEPLSETLNIDCTILLAFVSDISYGTAELESRHNKNVAQQMKTENEDLLLPNSLWPVCASRRLVCTKEAASTMQKLVDMIGTDTEKRRTDLLFNDALPAEEVRQAFQDLSVHTIPASWILPIEVVEVDLAAMIAACPPDAQKVSEALSPVNRSVFLYGWGSGMTTISSNGVAAKEIDNTIEKYRTAENVIGPAIWLSPSSRSLAGKEKKRR